MWYRMGCMVLRAVIDTSVVVAALRSRHGPANEVMRQVATKKLIQLATPPLFLEYEDVLKRPEHRLAHGLLLPQVDDFLSELAALIEPVEIHFQWRPQLRDPSDEMVLEAAINGGADLIITYNTADFRLDRSWFHVSVLRPDQYLQAQISISGRSVHE